MVSFQWNDQRHVEYVKINRYRQLALDGVVDTHMDFISSDAGSSPTNGGPQLSRQNQKPHGKNKIPHGKTKNLTAKTKYLTAKPKLFRFCCEVFGFAVRYFVFVDFCLEVFDFAMMFLFLPWGFWFCRGVFCFCRDVFGFAVTVVGHHTLHTTGNFPLAECNELSGKCFSHTPLGAWV